MMATHLGVAGIEDELTQIIREAVDSGECTADVGGSRSTSEVGDFVVSRLRGSR
jgi:isocitrate/isopropylmalate dehydrogenase